MNMEPRRLHISDEIIGLIAQDCVKTYSIAIILDPWRSPRTQIRGVPNVKNLMSVSRAFHHGISNALRECFDGQAYIMVGALTSLYVDEPQRLEQGRWLFSRITHANLVIDSKRGLEHTQAEYLACLTNIRTAFVESKVVDPFISERDAPYINWNRNEEIIPYVKRAYGMWGRFLKEASSEVVEVLVEVVSQEHRVMLLDITERDPRILSRR